MREIKFRAWDNIKSRMVDMQEKPADNGLTYEGYFHLLAGRGFDFPVMQFTGLQDIAGKDVFEGDVISYGYWNGDEAQGLCLHIVSWDSENSRFTSTVNDNPPLDYGSIDVCGEVIGNIHENPELLESK